LRRGPSEKTTVRIQNEPKSCKIDANPGGVFPWVETVLIRSPIGKLPSRLISGQPSQNLNLDGKPCDEAESKGTEGYGEGCENSSKSVPLPTEDGLE
jgi:hypothetical protein